MTTGGGVGSLIRQTTAGAVRGAREGEVLSWKGVPFAAPPVGERRFRRPARAEPWHELRDATHFGPMAPQRVLKSMEVVPGVSIAEDCLTLNIWAPRGSGGSDARKPVLVWIHGGGYFQGSTAQRYYDGRHLAANGDVVVVTVNYRLGVLGFVDFSSLADAAGPADRAATSTSAAAPGTSTSATPTSTSAPTTPTGAGFAHGFDSNLGLRDQIFALQWVRENIAAFGGDPDDVTLFGESAGGASVVALMASPLTTGLFHRAIAQSAPVTSIYGRQRARAVAERFLEIVGIAPGESHRLRELDAFDLVDAGAELVHEVSGKVPGTLAMAPMQGDDVLPEFPLTVFREGRAPRIPLIIGTNHDESSFFKLMRSPLLPITGEKVEQMFAEIAADRPEFEGAGARITGAYPAYPRRRTPAEVSRDAGFRMPSIWLAEAHSRFAPTWMYRFDHATPLLRVSGIGATHAAELAYVFGSFAPRGKDIVFGLGGRSEALRVSERMQARWLAFARTGDPDAALVVDAAGVPDAASVPNAEVVPDAASAPASPLADAPSWLRYDELSRSTLIIDRDDRVEHDPDADIREAWGPEILAFR